jgi:hypothetical protein
MSCPVFEAWEVEASEAPQRRVDRMRVKGYALATVRLAEMAREEFDKAVDALERARRRVEKAKKALEWQLEEAEAVARVVVADDPEWTAEVAQCLEECFG